MLAPDTTPGKTYDEDSASLHLRSHQSRLTAIFHQRLSHFSQLNFVRGRCSWLAGYQIDRGYCRNIPVLFKLCQNELSTTRRDSEEYHISVHQIEACEW